jgi:hypothetical protein
MSEQRDPQPQPAPRGLDRLRDPAWARQMNDAGEQWRSGLLKGEVAWLIAEVERHEQITEIVHRGVRMLQEGLGSSGARVKVDGLWVLVTVERSTSQRDVIGPTPPAGESTR